MEIFEISITFPEEENYSLTDQIRRSSRALCTCISEAYRKSKNEACFVSESSDADMENSETLVWPELSFECGYIVKTDYLRLRKKLNNCMVPTVY